MTNVLMDLWQSDETPEFNVYGRRCYVVNDRFVVLFENSSQMIEYVGTGTTLNIAIAIMVDHVTGD